MEMLYILFIQDGFNITPKSKILHDLLQNEVYVSLFPFQIGFDHLKCLIVVYSRRF